MVGNDWSPPIIPTPTARATARRALRFHQYSQNCQTASVHAGRATVPDTTTTTDTDFDSDRSVRLLYAFSFVIMLQPHAVIWVLYLTEFRDLTLAQVGIFESFFWGVSVLAEVPTGAFSDRFGRRAAFVAGAVVEGAGIAALAFASNFPILLLAYAFWSAGLAFRSGNRAAYLYDALAAAGRSDDFARIFGRVPAISAIASLGGGLVGAFLAARYTLRAPLLAALVPYTVAVAVGLLLREPPRARTAERTSYVRTITGGLDALRRNPPVRYMVLLDVSVAIIFFSEMLLEQPFLREAGVAIALFGLFHAPVELASAGGSLIAHRVAGWLGLRRTLGATLLVALAAAVVLALVNHVAAFGAMIVIAMAMGVKFPLAIGYLNESTPSDIRATVLSIPPLGRALVFGVMGPVIGLAADDSLGAAFALIAIVLLLAGTTAYTLWLRADREGAAATAGGR